MINEGDKVRLKDGRIALISEVQGGGAAFIVEAFGKDGHVHVDPITRSEIASIFVETEHPLTA